MFYRLLTILSLLVFISCGDEGAVLEQQSSPIAPAAPTSPVLVNQNCPAYLYKNTTNMRYIPSGHFTMGGAWETDHHKTPEWTAETDAFYMDMHEVTIGDFLLFMEMTGYELAWANSVTAKDYFDIETHERLAHGGHPSDVRPLYQWEFHTLPAKVSWYDAVAYATWIGKRLPTEVEWEKAARGGLKDDIPVVKGEANVVIAKLSDRPRFPWDTGFMFKEQFAVKPVGSYAPNPYGLFDMIGNIDEWCSDDWNVNAYLLLMNGIKPNPQPIDWDNGGHVDKVVRGGGIRHNVDMVSKYSSRIKDMEVNKQAQFLKATIHIGERTLASPAWTFGFRCVLDIDDKWKMKPGTRCPVDE